MMFLKYCVGFHFQEEEIDILSEIKSKKIKFSNKKHAKDTKRHFTREKDMHRWQMCMLKKLRLNPVRVITHLLE